MASGHGLPSLESPTPVNSNLTDLPSRRGALHSYANMCPKVVDIAERLTGLCIPPPFFRESAATKLARAPRQAARVIAPVLGQADHRTAEKHYIQIGSIAAARGYAAVMKALRGQR